MSQLLTGVATCRMINRLVMVSREIGKYRRRCLGEAQLPLGPFLALVEGAKPGKVGERMARCLGMGDLTPSERMVLARIAHYDGPGGAFPSHERIGADLGRSRRQVIRILASIRRKGRVRWERMHGEARALRTATPSPIRSRFRPIPNVTFWDLPM